MGFTSLDAMKELFSEYGIEARLMAGSPSGQAQFRLLKNGKNVGSGVCRGAEIEVVWSGRFNVDLHDPESILLIRNLIGSSKFS